MPAPPAKVYICNERMELDIGGNQRSLGEGLPCLSVHVALRIFQDTPQHFQRLNTIETVIDPLVKAPLRLQDLTHLRLPVAARDQNLFDRTDNTKKTACAVFV